MSMKAIHELEGLFSGTIGRRRDSVREECEGKDQKMIDML